MPGVTLQPAAGAHGELTGILMIRKALEARGEATPGRTGPGFGARHQSRHRGLCRIHGTGVPVGGRRHRGSRCPRPHDERPGCSGHADRAQHARHLRTPDRRGRGTGPLARRFHLHGRRQPQFLRRPRSAGADGRRRDAHQSPQDLFHPARRRWSGRRSGDGLRSTPPPPPGAEVLRQGDDFDLLWEDPASIGPMRGYYGNFLILVRALTYIWSLGAEGLRSMSDVAVLYANLVRHRLKNAYHLKYDSPVNARGRLRRLPADAARRPQHRHRQTAARLRLSPTDNVVPADRPRAP